MSTNDTQGWGELLDVALFEADRVHLQQRVEHATDAIQRRKEELLKDANMRAASRNALHSATR
jgi:hypothetical protein